MVNEVKTNIMVFYLGLKSELEEVGAIMSLY